jgi:dTDP-4-dehydrorhamnose reductase
MLKERLLITGGTGLLGLNWAIAMRDSFDVILMTNRHQCNLMGTSSIGGNLGDESDFLKLVNRIQPHMIVHTVGMSSVDECEANPDLTETINVSIAKVVASVAKQAGIQMIHISTDHLFNGDQKNYIEESLPLPLNVYARTKLEAEIQVAIVNPTALIVRTNFFGWGSPHRKSFSDWLIDNLRSGIALRAFKDVFFSPILISRLAKASHILLDRRIQGVINIVGDERISKFDFAIRLAKIFKLPANLILSSSIGEISLKAHRPLDMSLSNAKASILLQNGLGSIDEFLYDLKNQEQSGHHAELTAAFK